jgi:hypothetical protein
MEKESPRDPIDAGRRNFLKLIRNTAPVLALKFLRVTPMVALPLSLTSSERKETEPEAVWSRDLDDANIEPDLEKLTDGLRKELKFGEHGDTFVGDYFALIQKSRRHLEGESIQDSMLKTLDPDTNTRLRVTARKGLKDHGLSGYFTHSNRAEKPSEASVEESLPLAEALYTVDHEFVHAVFGQSEVIAYGYSLLSQLLIAVEHPDVFIRGADKKTSPLLGYTDRLTNGVIRQEKKRPGTVSNIMALLEYIDELMTEPEIHTLTGGKLIFEMRDRLVALEDGIDVVYRDKYEAQRKKEGDVHLERVVGSVKKFITQVIAPFDLRVPFEQ